MIVSPTIGNIEKLLVDFFQNNSYSKIIVLCDENTLEYCYPIIENIFSTKPELIQIKSGEEYKNIETCVFIWEKLTQYQTDRNALLINLGGGVIGDMGGFCASTYKRGIDFINIPTTLLAQVDAGLGGKLGIDFKLLKNHIGLFKEPVAILTDPLFLNTLPERQIKSGFAEIIKHSLIKSKTQWDDLLSKKYNEYDWSEIIPKSIEIKKDIVSRDFKETGERKLLNFGHTIGHAIETLLISQGKDIFHGEAVAAGMIMESFIALKAGKLSSGVYNEIVSFIDSYYERLFWLEENEEEILKLIKQDKKNKGNEILMTLLEDIGISKWDFAIDDKIILDSMHNYLNN
ncbi:MAG: 3-dehydroquinate synthase [Cyclobacteriaceae bacterium]|nr:3-dehydroquinate synthase [Cyclobacteriaceae bacterium]